METCVVVSQQRTQYVSTGKGRHTSPSSNCFSQISCRDFEYAAGLLPTPSKSYTISSSTSSCSSAHLARNCSSPDAEPKQANCSLNSPKSEPIRIKTKGYRNGLSCREFTYSEHWAGPAYSNSPPPSSVPIPKFSSRSKPTRTVSLDLPVVSKSVVEICSLAKSAPSSPRESHTDMDLFGTADNATKALRRILNLDMCDG